MAVTQVEEEKSVDRFATQQHKLKEKLIEVILIYQSD